MSVAAEFVGDEVVGGYFAFSGQVYGARVAAEFVGDEVVGGLVVVSRAEEDATAEDESLGCGACANEGLELASQISGQINGRAKGTWHDKPPVQQRRITDG